jgi:hypothetical protein
MKKPPEGGFKQLAEEAGCSDYIKIAFKVNGYISLN